MINITIQYCYTHTHTHTDTHMCMYMCMCVCVCVCVCKHSCTRSVVQFSWSVYLLWCEVHKLLRTFYYPRVGVGLFLLTVVIQFPCESSIITLVLQVTDHFQFLRCYCSPVGVYYQVVSRIKLKVVHHFLPVAVGQSFSVCRVTVVCVVVFICIIHFTYW